MTTEQYSIGYEAGYQDGWNEAQKPFVGLTDEEIQAEWLLTPQHDKAEGVWFGRRLEAKFKEKNGGHSAP